jgi:hypothetical protein
MNIDYENNEGGIIQNIRADCVHSKQSPRRTHCAIDMLIPASIQQQMIRVIGMLIPAGADSRA